MPSKALGAYVKVLGTLFLHSAPHSGSTGLQPAGHSAPGLPVDTWLWVSVARQVSALHTSLGDALVSALCRGTSGLWEVGSQRLREFGLS